MNWPQRLDAIALGLMLVYVVIIVIRVSNRCRLARPTGETAAARTRKQLFADLNIQLSNLKSIALIAPYLGLGGTCIGILTASTGFGMEKNAAMEMMAASTAATLVTTAAGILVAVPANCLHNYLRMRMDLHKSESSDEPLRDKTTCRFPLTKRFSKIPAFGLLAATGLAVLVAVFTPFFAPRVATGFGIQLPSTYYKVHCGDRVIVLRVTNAGRIFINSEEQEWKTLAEPLSKIYDGKKYRILYLLAEDDVPFQAVADAVDIAENIPEAGSPDSPDIAVRLITPAATNDPCLSPVVAGHSRHAGQ